MLSTDTAVDTNTAENKWAESDSAPAKAEQEDEDGRSATKSTQKQKRMSFLFSSESIERLEDVKNLTSATTYSEILRNALLLYEDYVKSPQEGYEYYKRRIDTDNRAVVLPLTGKRK